MNIERLEADGTIGRITIRFTQKPDEPTVVQVNGYPLVIEPAAPKVMAKSLVDALYAFGPIHNPNIVDVLLVDANTVEISPTSAHPLISVMVAQGLTTSHAAIGRKSGSAIFSLP